MAAIITSFASGVSVTGGTLGSTGVAVIPTQSDIRTNGSNTGIVVSTPSGNIYSFTNDDMGASTAAEAAIVLLNALNGTSMRLLTFSLTQANISAPVITDGYNPSGISLVASYVNVGRYRITGPSGCFPSGTTVVAGNINAVSDGGDAVFYAVYSFSGGNVLEISTLGKFGGSDATYSNNVLNNTSFHIVIPV